MRRVIALSDEAESIALAFYNECEQEQLKGRKYAHIQPFASRGSQIARRLATCFAYFESEQAITAQSMQAACDIVRHSLGEWLRYADIESKKESDAERLIKWLVGYCRNAKRKIDKLAYSSFMNNCPRPMRGNKQLLECAVNELIDCHYLKIEEIAKTRYVLFNPILLIK